MNSQARNLFSFMTISILLLAGCSGEPISANLEEQDFENVPMSEDVLMASLAAASGLSEERLLQEVEKQKENSAGTDNMVLTQVELCVLDANLDGTMNLLDIGVLGLQNGKSCSEVALDAVKDPSKPDDLRCMDANFDGVVDLSDIAKFGIHLPISYYVPDQEDFKLSNCTDENYGDNDGVSVAEEIIAYVPLHPLDPDTDGDGIGDGVEFPSFGSPSYFDLGLGGAHSCGLRNGVAMCWGTEFDGWTDYGYLGNGSLENGFFEVDGITDAIAIDAGSTHSCAVHYSGNVSCWGSSAIGNGETSGTALTPVSVLNIENAVDIALGNKFTCALHATGQVSCWGKNDRGQLGTEETGCGSMQQSAEPVLVSGIDNAVEISAGAYSACARLDDGTVKCWGYNEHGELGSGEMNYGVCTPVQTLGITDAVDIAIDQGGHGCAVHSTGEISCWGRNSMGELGDGTIQDSANPVRVSGITNARSVVTGDYSVAGGFTCALLDTGEVKCWGINSYGQLGFDAYADSSSVPVNVFGIENAIQIAAGSKHACALLESGELRCWGDNRVMQAVGQEVTLFEYPHVEGWLPFPQGVPGWM